MEIPACRSKRSEPDPNRALGARSLIRFSTNRYRSVATEGPPCLSWKQKLPRGKQCKHAWILLHDTNARWTAELLGNHNASAQLVWKSHPIQDMCVTTSEIQCLPCRSCLNQTRPYHNRKDDQDVVASPAACMDRSRSSTGYLGCGLSAAPTKLQDAKTVCSVGSPVQSHMHTKH